MEKDTKTIIISKNLWLKLSQLKLNSFKSFNDLIKWLVYIYEVHSRENDKEE